MISIRFTRQLHEARKAEREEKFIGDEEPIAGQSQCEECVHRHDGELSCEAFPEGIPVGFLTGDLDHSKPYPGDGGITYEPLYSEGTEYVQKDWREVPRDERGRWTEDENGPAASLMKGYSNAATEQSVLDGTLSKEEQEIFRRAQEDGSKGPSTKEMHTIPGTKAYTKERLDLHRRLINSVIDAARAHATPTPLADGTIRPKLIVLGGRGGSGKSNFDKDEGTKGFGAYSKKEYLTLDADKFKDLLAKADGLPGVGNKAFKYHQESGDLFDRAVVKARRLGLNVVLDVTLNSAHLDRVKAFKARGYHTAAYYMHLPPHLAAQRAVTRWKQPDKEVTYDGRLVPPKVVLGMRNNEKNFDKVAKLTDEFSVYRNDVPRGEKPIHVAGVRLES